MVGCCSGLPPYLSLSGVLNDQAGGGLSFCFVRDIDKGYVFLSDMLENWFLWGRDKSN